MRPRRVTSPSPRVRFEPKPVPRPKIRRWPVWLRPLGIVLVCIAVFYAIVWAPYFRISEIGIAGNRIVKGDDMREKIRARLAGVNNVGIPRNSVFFYPQDEVVTELMSAFPRLLRADVFAESSRILYVSVAERAPEAVWCPGLDECYFLDGRGMAYAPAPHFSGGIFLEFSGSSSPAFLPVLLLPEGEFAPLLEFSKDVAGMVAGQFESLGTMTGVDVRENREVAFIFRYPGGGVWELKARQADISNDTLLSISAGLGSISGGLTPETLEYVDARITTKLFYKYQDRE